MLPPSDLSSPRVLLVGGSDPLAYSGVEADLRHASALNAVGLGVRTASVPQSVHELLDLVPVVVEDLRRELGSLPRVDAIKIGMLHRAAVVAAVAEAVHRRRVPVVLDPVLATSGGAMLLDADGQRELLRHLDGWIVTPNRPELEMLAPGGSEPDRVRVLLDAGAKAVLVKDGHGRGPDVIDRLHTQNGVREFSAPRLPGPGPRGTGCALATALAVGLARGATLETAVGDAIGQVRTGIVRCHRLGTRFLVFDAVRPTTQTRPSD